MKNDIVFTYEMCKHLLTGYTILKHEFFSLEKPKPKALFQTTIHKP